jgi:hypothetical protein
MSEPATAPQCRLGKGAGRCAEAVLRASQANCGPYLRNRDDQGSALPTIAGRLEQRSVQIWARSFNDRVNGVEHLELLNATGRLKGVVYRYTLAVDQAPLHRGTLRAM